MTWKVYQDEVLPYWLMVTKERGLDVDYINWSCPSDLQPYAKAHEQEMKGQDLLNYIAFGQYYRSALAEMMSTVLGSFSKKKNKPAQFTDEPALAKAERESKPLTEEEIIRNTELFFKERQRYKAIFDNAKKRG